MLPKAARMISRSVIIFSEEPYNCGQKPNNREANGQPDGNKAGEYGEKEQPHQYRNQYVLFRLRAALVNLHWNKSHLAADADDPGCGLMLCRKVIRSAFGTAKRFIFFQGIHINWVCFFVPFEAKNGISHYICEGNLIVTIGFVL